MTRTLSLLLASTLVLSACDDEDTAGEANTDTAAAEDQSESASDTDDSDAKSLDDIPACKTYFSDFKECHGADNPTVKTLIAGFQKQLDGGTKSAIIGQACEKANAKFKCSATKKSSSKDDGDDADEADKADDKKRGDVEVKKGLAAAWEMDGTPIVERHCRKKGRTYLITTCAKSVRTAVKLKLCKKLGKGTHEYQYHSGLGTLRTNKVFCR